MLTTSNYATERAELAARHNRSVQLGFNHGKTGNAAMFVAAGILVTPTKRASSEPLRPEQIVLLPHNYQGGAMVGGKPTSEWPIYKALGDLLRTGARQDIKVAVHWHSVFGTAQACRLQKIECFHYEVLLLGGRTVRCVPYTTPGGPELGAAIARALGKRRLGCLMGKHGMLAVGSSIEDAWDNATSLEWVAATYRLAGKRGRRPMSKRQIREFEQMLELGCHPTYHRAP